MQFPDLVPRALVTLTKRGISVIGEREARLLDAVDRVRSIKDAASEAGISLPHGVECHSTDGTGTRPADGRVARRWTRRRGHDPDRRMPPVTRAVSRLRRRLEEILAHAWEAPEGAAQAGD